MKRFGITCKSIKIGIKSKWGFCEQITTFLSFFSYINWIWWCQLHNNIEKYMCKINWTQAVFFNLFRKTNTLSTWRRLRKLKVGAKLVKFWTNTIWGKIGQASSAEKDTSIIWKETWRKTDGVRNKKKNSLNFMKFMELTGP